MRSPTDILSNLQVWSQAFMSGLVPFRDPQLFALCAPTESPSPFSVSSSSVRFNNSKMRGKKGLL